MDLTKLHPAVVVIAASADAASGELKRWPLACFVDQSFAVISLPNLHELID
jgi:hypothetical protein